MSIYYFQALKLYFRDKKEKVKKVKKDTPEYNEIMVIKDKTNCPNKQNAKYCPCPKN